MARPPQANTRLNQFKRLLQPLNQPSRIKSSDLKPESVNKYRFTRAVAHAGVELAKMANASRILVAMNVVMHLDWSP